MWKRLLAIILIFYLFALLQNSFFAQFNLFGAVPNLVFIFFFLLVFFEKPNTYLPGNYQIIFLALIAGIFLDFLSFTYLGSSIMLLLGIGFSVKGVQSMLSNRDNDRPFFYFLPLFIIFFLVYQLLFS